MNTSDTLAVFLIGAAAFYIIHVLAKANGKLMTVVELQDARMHRLMQENEELRDLLADDLMDDGDEDTHPEQPDWPPQFSRN